MSPLDLLILVVYTITVILVMARAIESVERKTSIRFNNQQLNERLASHNLKGLFNVSMSFASRYAVGDHPKQLSIGLTNTSSDKIFYVDWDRSWLTDLSSRSRRVIRLIPHTSPDLAHAQILTVIPPGRSVQETVTAEDTLAPDSSNNGVLKPAKPLINVGAIAKLPERAELSYSLWLAVQIGDLDAAQPRAQIYLLPCDIVVQKMPWTDSLPWK